MPPELTVTGANAITFPSMATWGGAIALYLFLGGLVAGLMIFSGVLRLARPNQFLRALFVADLASLPLLGIGLLCLFLDLSNKGNVWRLYTTFQMASPMSWGAWILLVTMGFLALRFVALTPAPRPAALGSLRFFPAPPVTEQEAVERAEHQPSGAVRLIEWAWTLFHQVAAWANRASRVLACLSALLGTGVGFYTGVLLSTLPARPLWNTAILAPLFLVSGLASGGAFLCLFLPAEEHQRLAPASLSFCGVELLLLAAFVIFLSSGNAAAQRAGALMFSGTFSWVFWGLIILAGLVLPAALEQLELMHYRLPFGQGRVPPVLKLAGGLALRFVIVYAGLLSFV